MREDILLIKKKGPICTLILNRPEKRNALSIELLYRIEEALDQLKTDQGTKVVVIRGKGEKVFSSGFDITCLPSANIYNDDSSLFQSHPLDRLLCAIEDFPCPVIAMMNGSAYGGGLELAIACDLRISADDIQVSISASKLGIVYPWKGLQRFIQTIGLAATKQLLFTAQPLKGKAIKSIGLAQLVVPRTELQKTTYDLAYDISTKSSSALMGMKRVLNLLMRSNSLNQEYKEESDRLWEASLISSDVETAKASFSTKKSDKE